MAQIKPTLEVDAFSRGRWENISIYYYTGIINTYCWFSSSVNI